MFHSFIPLGRQTSLKYLGSCKMMLATTMPPNGVIEDGTAEERHPACLPSSFHSEPVQDILMVRASSPCQDVANAGYRINDFVVLGSLQGG